MRGGVALCTATAMAISALPAPAALGAGDPVASGYSHIDVSQAFRKQLRRSEVRMTPKAFELRDGSVDPIDGSGSVDLKGKLRFKHDGATAIYAKLSITLGEDGTLRGYATQRDGDPARRPTKLFDLGGGEVRRNGFGAGIRDIDVKLLRSAAKRLNRRLDLNSLRKGRVGSLSVSEQPKTVEVTGGQVELIPSAGASPPPGTLASKVTSHCILFSTGVTAIAPGVKIPPNLNPTFRFPLTGGTIGPQATDGVVQQAGGIRLRNDLDDGGDPCPDTPTATLEQFDTQYDLLAKNVQSRAVVTGPAPPLGGDRGQSVGFRIDSSNATVSADPDAQTITIRGAMLTLAPGAALALNVTFINYGSPSDEFAGGDLLGTMNMTVEVR